MNTERKIQVRLIAVGLLCVLLNTEDARAASTETGTFNWIPTAGQQVWSTGVDTHPGDGVTTLPNTENMDISNGSDITVNSAITGTGGNKIRVLDGGLITFTTGGSVTGYDNTFDIQSGGSVSVTGGTLSPGANQSILVNGSLSLSSGILSTDNGQLQVREQGTLSISGGTLNIANDLEIGRATGAGETSFFSIFGSTASITTGGDFDLYANTDTDSGLRVLDLNFDSSGISTINAGDDIFLDPSFGTSRLDLDLDGFTSDGSSAINLLQATGTRNGEFDEIVMADGLMLAASKDNLQTGQYFIDYTANGVDLYVNTIPEPASLALMAFFGGMLFWSRRRLVK